MYQADADGCSEGLSYLKVNCHLAKSIAKCLSNCRPAIAVKNSSSICDAVFTVSKPSDGFTTLTYDHINSWLCAKHNAFSPVFHCDMAHVNKGVGLSN